MDDFTTPQPARQGPASPRGENATLAACLAIALIAAAQAAPGYATRVQEGYQQATLNHIAAEAAREG